MLSRQIVFGPCYDRFDTHLYIQYYIFIFPIIISLASGTVKKHLQFGWDFDLIADFTTDGANTMKVQLRERFVTWSNALATSGVQKPFCNVSDCSDLVIDVVNFEKNFRLTFDIDAVP